MFRCTLLPTAGSLLLAVAAVAQAGNEVVFVGSSTSGNTDYHAFAESGAPNLLFTAPSAFTNNVTDAAWADTGRSLYVAQTLSNRVSVGAWNGASMTWSTLYQATGGCYGVGVDAGRRRVWTMMTPAATGDLVCIDADPTSASYGMVLATTTNLNTAIRERWRLSPSGSFACVPYGFLDTGLFEIVDTDPASPTFLQTVVSLPMPAAQQGGLSFVFDVQISVDELYCFVLYAGLGFTRLGVYSRASNSFVDFNPAANGQQDLTLGFAGGNSLALAPDRSFALVSSATAPGRVARVGFDYAAPGNTTVTTFAGLSVPFANGVSLSPDGLRGAVTTTAGSVSGPGSLEFFDASTGATTGSVALGNMWNLYTTAWQDGSPNGTFGGFGAGCAGSLGVPSIAAAPGQRPRLGSAFTIDAGGLPYGIALMWLGTSNVTSSGLPLPLPLAGLGMPGCSLLVETAYSAALVGPSSTAGFTLAIPNNAALFQVSLYCQAFSLDPFANAFGFAASAGGALRIGL